MVSSHDERRCTFCKAGKTLRSDQTIAFRHFTDKGYIYCRATVPVDICNHCRSKSWDGVAEAIIADVVRREYEKISSGRMEPPHAG
jgi:hypothetical protein